MRCSSHGLCVAGRSDRSAYRSDRYATLSGYAQDLLELLAALRCEPCVFAGASIIGMVGLLAALEEPARFSRLVMIGSSAATGQPASFRWAATTPEPEPISKKVDWSPYFRRDRVTISFR